MKNPRVPPASDPVRAPSPTTRRTSLLWAVPGHAAAIAQAHQLLFPEPWDEAAIAKLVSHPGSIGLVATRASPQDIVGFALAVAAADEAEILSLGVVPACQRQGIGRDLVDGIKRAARRDGARALFLEVAIGNTAAVALYAANGFAEAGRRKAYYARAGAAPEDAVVMRCPLEA